MLKTYSGRASSNKKLDPHDRSSSCLVWKLRWGWHFLFYSECLNPHGFHFAAINSTSLVLLWAPRMLNQLKQSELPVCCSLKSLCRGPGNNNILGKTFHVWHWCKPWIYGKMGHTTQGQRCPECDRVFSSLDLSSPVFWPMDVFLLLKLFLTLPLTSPLQMYWDVGAFSFWLY